MEREKEKYRVRCKKKKREMKERKKDTSEGEIKALVTNAMSPRESEHEFYKYNRCRGCIYFKGASFLRNCGGASVGEYRRVI